MRVDISRESVDLLVKGKLPDLWSFILQDAPRKSIARRLIHISWRFTRSERDSSTHSSRLPDGKCSRDAEDDHHKLTLSPRYLIFTTCK
jgi:hypothetical protein